MNNVVKAPMTNKRDWKFHRDRIAGAWGKQVESIIETGQALIEAKAELGHGSFEAMVQSKLPFAKNTAHRLRVIAENEILSKVAHAPHLPSSWMTIYELTKLPDEVLITALKDGSIHPKMERKDAKALNPNVKAKSSSKSKPKTEDLIKAIDDNSLLGALTEWAKGKSRSERAEKLYPMIVAILDNSRGAILQLNEIQLREAQKDGRAVKL